VSLVPSGKRYLGLFATIALVGFVALAEQASAVLSGSNGRIVFISGRGEASDATAKPYLRTVTSGVGAGSAGPAITTAAGQHRHPSWSPDRTKVVYARGGSGCAAPKCDLFVLDLTDPGATPVNLTNTANVNEDRPAWSPDGTRIAFESEVTDGSGQLDILVVAAPDVPPITPINLTASPAIDSKPAWSPDSQTLFYGRGNPNVAPSGPPPVSVDILREPADNSGTATFAVPDTGVHEFQPSISPDGTKICFTLGDGFNANAAVMVGPLTSPPTGATPFATETGGNYNCTWSPDGTRVAYVNGIFNNGDLVMKPASGVGFFPLESTPARFDGNPDWAPDGRPVCEDGVATTEFGAPVTITLDCADTGPEYERTPVRVDIPADAQPANGTLGPVDDGPPHTVTYTPNPGFSGSDSFQIRPRDDVGFGEGRGTIEVTVAAPPRERFRIVRVKKNKRKGTAKLVVSLPEAGLVRLKRTRKVKAARVRRGSAGNVRVAVKPRGKTKRKLKRRGKAKVTAKLTFRPDAGGTQRASKRIKLLRKRR
jgi:Tol biopolymer transport system component